MYFFLFKTLNSSCNYSTNLTYSCVFWDFKLNNGYGDWNPSGCSLKINSSVYYCSCNHTTNFAVLLVICLIFGNLIFFHLYLLLKTNNPLYPPTCTWCEDALFYASLIGSCLSIFFLFISMITFINIERFFHRIFYFSI